MKALILRISLLVLSLLLAAIAIFPLVTRYYAQSGQDRSQNPPNYDALAASDKSAGARVQTQGQPQMEAGRAVQMEARMGVPTFLWSSDIGVAKSLPTQAAERRATIEATAREHLGRHASRYRLKSTEVAEARLAEIHDPGMGAIIARFRQSVGGVEVFRDEVKVMMNRQLQLVAISGYITGTENAVVTTAFNLSPQKAIAVAMGDLTNTTVDESAFEKRNDVAREREAASGTAQNPYSLFEAGSRARLQFRVTDPARVKQVMFHLPDQFVPAYYIEVHVELPSEGGSVVSLNSATGGVISRDYSYVISAIDGQLLFRKTLVADQGKAPQGKNAKNVTTATSYTYRVWADPVTKVPQDGPQGNGATPKTNPAPDFFQAPFVAPSDVSLISGPISTGDPWLPDGATETNGNNADAFLDIASPDGFNGADFRGMITAPGAFLHTYDTTQQPTSTESRLGAIQQLFYMNNFLHDWYYDVGFNETAGNAQTSNYGRGGLENDNIKAQGQDFASRNNANMLTPADGGRPRMRMYVFDANVLKYVNVVSPANIAGKLTNVGTGQFGQQVFNVTNQVVQPTTPAGCAAGDYAGVSGKFVLVDRQPTSGAGSCSIGTKLNNAMAAGAAGFILVNLQTTPDTAVSVTGSLPTFTIPFLSVTWNGAAGMKTELAVPNVVTATMRRDAPGVDRDGTIDNQVVAHEWGHYLSNRLIGDANGINNNQAGGMGEGWGDTSSMILSVRADDINIPSNANWAGVYAMAGYVTSGGEENNGYYYGIRRYPYSTDLTKNPLTFKHIQNGNALPVGPPVRFGADGAANAEVHNTGEVWAVMLWECYAALLRDTLGGSPRLTFDQAQQRMRLYLVTSLKMTPVSPTFTEARDAVLAAAGANDPVDYAEFLQAFAKRGIGIGAVSPDRFDGNNATVVESFVSGKDLQFLGATLDDTPASCDHDGVLDNGETGKLTITLKNTGDANLGPISATVTSASPGVTVLNGGNLIFPATVPDTQTTATINVTLNGALSTIQQLNFTLTYGDPMLLAPATRTQALSFRANTNLMTSSSATDDVESPNVKWTTGHGATGATGLVSVAPFVRREVSAVQHEFFGTDASVGTDEYLISPVLTVNGAGSLNLQFDHSWGFEFDGGGNYDGGVVEMSVNGGAYTDIGASAYNGTILNYSGDVNPLKGRQGFVQNSAGTVHTSLTQAIAPGSTVRIRFRIGTDGGLGAAGWHIDNIAFTGIVETPFDKVVADSGCLLCPTDIAVNSTPNQCGAIVNYAKPTFGTVTCNPDTGSFFSVGMTTVTCMSNAAPNCTFKVTVTDNQPPTVSCPGNQSVLAPVGQTTAVVNYPAPTYNDNCSATVICTPPGNVFPVGVTTVSCKATDPSQNMSQPCTFTVSVCPTITLGSLSGGQAGVAYNQSVAASPAGTYTYTVTGGSLPTGLALNPNTGAVTGTPSTVGAYSFTIKAQDASGCSGTQSYSVQIACPTVSLNPAALPNATINTAYGQTITATPAGTTYSFSLTSGLLPPGLTLNSNGTFSGAPTADGTFSFRVTASGFGGCTGFRDYTLVVLCQTITVAPASLPGGTVGTAYSQAVSASPAGAYTFSVSSGSLPPGLTLNAATGAITGTPTTTGSFTFTIKATAGGCFGTLSYTVVIGCPTISFTTTSPLLAGQAGVAYSLTLNVTPAGSYNFSLTAGGLTSGLTLNASTGVISGVPTTTGTSTFTVKAQAANGCSATQIYTLVIGCPTITVNPASLPGGTTGSAYSQTITASPAGGNYSYSVSGTLPPGFNLNFSTGILSGTPTSNGSFTFTVTATGWGGCTGSRQYTVVIGGGGCATIALPASLPNGNVGQIYTNSVGASPSDSYTYTATGNLPPGLTLYASFGLLFGFPTTPGSYTFTVTATAGSCIGSQQYTVNIGTGSASALTVFSDFDGDGKSDLSVWRGVNSNWLIARSSDGQSQSTPWGSSAAPYNDLIASGDYDGDGKTDLAIFRRGTAQAGHWYIKRSSDGQVKDTFWGLGTDIPVAGDYDGDGKTDIAVWRGSEGNWYIQRSSDGAVDAILWGAASVGDVPVPGDYDGDGKTDVAVFRRGIQPGQGGYWYIKLSSNGQTVSKLWGMGTDVPVPGDYDGDGKTDIAVWRGSDTNWYILQSKNNAIRAESWGASSMGDMAVPGDYDGDGKADVAIWRESAGMWYVKLSGDSSVMSKALGQSGDVPIVARKNN